LKQDKSINSNNLPDENELVTEKLPPEVVQKVTKSDTKEFKFGGELKISPSFQLDVSGKLELFFKVFKKKYYLGPSFFLFDASKRIIYTQDKSIIMRMNFNFINIDHRYLYFIMTILQMRLLGVATNQQSEEYINLVAEYLSLKVKYKYSNRIVSITRSLFGVETEKVVLVLTSEQFNKEVENQIFRAHIKFDSKGFRPRDST
jgi:hypothetical protein